MGISLEGTNIRYSGLRVPQTDEIGFVECLVCGDRKPVLGADLFRDAYRVEVARYAEAHAHPVLPVEAP